MNPLEKIAIAGAFESIDRAYAYITQADRGLPTGVKAGDINIQHLTDNVACAKKEIKETYDWIVAMRDTEEKKCP